MVINMDNKYIDLLLDKCVDFKSKKLFINYDIEVSEFVNLIIDKAKAKGIVDVYLESVDVEKDCSYLKEHTINEICDSDYFDESIWDEYAKMGASFLIIDTEQPHVMDDIDPEKISAMARKRRESRPIYRKMVEHCELSWCILAYPSKRWAKEVFPDSNDSYQDLLKSIYKVCMIDKDSPTKAWDEQLEKVNKVIERLNALDLVKLHYINGLGTDLEVYLPDGYRYDSAKDGSVIVNMPSYEVFTSPIYNKTNGIVYSSKPLSYSGSIIDEFWIKFKDGMVVDYDAKKGREVLKQIIEIDDHSCYLGECALVEYDSPISNLGINFGTTLIDENASCHLALGAGFPECIDGGLGLSDEELLKRGVNVSKGHVDFMIGTSDMRIVGTTSDGKEIPIFVDGNFSKEIV